MVLKEKFYDSTFRRCVIIRFKRVEFQAKSNFYFFMLLISRVVSNNLAFCFNTVCFFIFFTINVLKVAIRKVHKKTLINFYRNLHFMLRIYVIFHKNLYFQTRLCLISKYSQTMLTL